LNHMISAAIVGSATLIEAVATTAPNPERGTNSPIQVRKPDIVAPLPFLTDAPACT
jgi:hypothetical protein